MKVKHVLIIAVIFVVYTIILYTVLRKNKTSSKVSPPSNVVSTSYELLSVIPTPSTEAADTHSTFSTQDWIEITSLNNETMSSSSIENDVNTTHISSTNYDWKNQSSPTYRMH